MASLYTNCRLYSNLFSNNDNKFVNSISIKGNNTFILTLIISCIFILIFALILVLLLTIRFLPADKLVFNNELFKQFIKIYLKT